MFVWWCVLTPTDQNNHSHMSILHPKNEMKWNFFSCLLNYEYKQKHFTVYVEKGKYKDCFTVLNYLYFTY